MGSCDEFFAYRILHALVRGTPGEVLSADLRRLVEGKGKAQTKSSSEGSANAGGSLAGVVCDNSAASFIAKVSLGPIQIGERDGSPTSGTGNGGGGGDEKSGKKKNAKKKQKKKGKEKEKKEKEEKNEKEKKRRSAMSRLSPACNTMHTSHGVVRRHSVFLGSDSLQMTKSIHVNVSYCKGDRH